MAMIDDLEIQQILRRVAEENDTDVRSVRRNILQALSEAHASMNAEHRKAWAQIPRAGDTPTLEEVLRYLAGRMGGIR